MIQEKIGGYWSAGRHRLRLVKTAVVMAATLAFFGSVSLWGQATIDPTLPRADTVPHLDIYGAAMLDAGFESGQSHPDWFDVMRPTQLPSFTDQYGKDQRFFAGVRQSRLGFKGFVPTSAGVLKTTFEFELFGTGVDAGQTTFRLRHAYGELRKIGAGQTWSTFMDPDVFPNSIEYWGPNGMVFFRNVQVRFIPWSKGDSELVVSAERPGASADQGAYAGRIELAGVQSRFPAPDIAGHYKWAGKVGHLQIGGIYRRINWDDLNATPTSDFTGSADGWGVNVSTNIKIAKKHVLRLQYVYGEGIENYMNDAPADIGVETNAGNTKTPLIGKPLPVLGIVSFLDLNWSDKVTSTLGYSRVDIDNSNAQAANAFKVGQYALANILYYPAKNVMMGPEVQWGHRENKDGFDVQDYKIQFSAKYSFNFKVGG